NRGAALFPIGEKLVQPDRIDRCAGKNMGADLGALFDDTDAGVPPRRLRELLQTDRRRKARRAGANDHHVEFHAFARICHGRLIRCGASPGQSPVYDAAMTTPLQKEALETLRWLIEAGADEVITEFPANRFAARPSSPAPIARASAGQGYEQPV